MPDRKPILGKDKFKFQMGIRNLELISIADTHLTRATDFADAAQFTRLKVIKQYLQEWRDEIMIALDEIGWSDD